jgi:hypothetical protein
MKSLWVSYAWIVSNWRIAHSGRFHPHPHTRRPQLSPAQLVAQACATKADFRLSSVSGLLY